MRVDQAQRAVAARARRRRAAASRAPRPARSRRGRARSTIARARRARDRVGVVDGRHEEAALEVDVDAELPFVQSDERWLAHVLVNLSRTPSSSRPKAAASSCARTSAASDDAVDARRRGHRHRHRARGSRARSSSRSARASDGDTKGYGGVGLGLALVAQPDRPARRAGRARLDVGKGSTFRVIVPLDCKGRAVSRADARGRPRRSTSRPRLAA